MKKILFWTVFSVVLVFAIFIGLFIFETEYKLTDVGTEASPDGRYEISFQMIGEPAWPFGPTSVKITVCDTKNKRKIKEIKTSISDDGAVLHQSNWSVEWKEKLVLITLKGSEQEDCVYEVDLDG